MSLATTPEHPKLTNQNIEALDIAVLMGGISDEREVSLQSGQAVAAGLSKLGHRVTSFDITPDDLSALDHDSDLCFLALHGAFGEDGELQNILERRSIRFCGSGAMSSRCAMNKVTTKAAMLRSRVPTPAFEVVSNANLNASIDMWTLPVVVKPIDQGSSVDTFIVRDQSELGPSLERLVSKYGCCMIEEYIQGIELTVGILGSETMPVCQITTPREFYDYEAKYLRDDTQYNFDIDLPGSLLEEIQHLSLIAHRAVHCRDFSRVDWLVDSQRTQPYALEINTIPGFTSHSLLPKSAARAGYSFEDLCQKIVDMTMARDS